jgi:hypothetical protein
MTNFSHLRVPGRNANWYELSFMGLMVQSFLMQTFGMRTLRMQTFLVRIFMMRTLRVQTLTMLISRAPYSIPQLGSTSNRLLSHGIGD